MYCYFADEMCFWQPHRVVVVTIVFQKYCFSLCYDYARVCGDVTCRMPSRSHHPRYVRIELYGVRVKLVWIVGWEINISIIKTSNFCQCFHLLSRIHFTISVIRNYNLPHPKILVLLTFKLFRGLNLIFTENKKKLNVPKWETLIA